MLIRVSVCKTKVLSAVGALHGEEILDLAGVEGADDLPPLPLPPLQLLVAENVVLELLALVDEGGEVVGAEGGSAVGALGREKVQLLAVSLGAGGP